jgi:nicotinate-nucleotide pyrophosphorylase (carboxylating)
MNSKEKQLERARVAPLPLLLNAHIERWLLEDAPSFDFSGSLVDMRPASGTLWQKSAGVVAGRPFFDAVFETLGCSVTWRDEGTTSTTSLEGQYWDGAEGSSSAGKRPLATVRGPARRLLQGERTALNLLSRCSGVATRARQFKQLCRVRQWHGVIAGTRKTTPGFRLVEKYGMHIGGADMHRVDLSGMIMLKDNHLACIGLELQRAPDDPIVIQEAVRRARNCAGFSVSVEVECGSEASALAAITAGADVIMLDNMDPETFCETAKRLREKTATMPHCRYLIEASGGITLETAPRYMCAAADIISVSLSQGYECVDYSLKVSFTNREA